jgi:hypothetical protein
MLWSRQQKRASPWSAPDVRSAKSEESVMLTKINYASDASRLRFLFAHRVVSLPLTGLFTFGDVAQALAGLPLRRTSIPVGIAVTMPTAIALGGN